MGYKDYDKSEAKRVYEESVARHKAESDEISRQAIQGVVKLIIASALAIFLAFIIINTVKLQPETYTVTTRESVVVTRMRLPSGKNSKLVVEYYTVEDKVSGEFETRDIWFSIRDTIEINISRTVLVKNNQR